MLTMPLRRAGSEYAGRTVARRADGAAGTFAAAHGEDDRLALYGDEAVFRADSRDGFIFMDVENHRIDEDFDFRFILYQVVASLRVARAGQLFLEVMQAEAVVDALLENAARFAVAFEDEDFLRAVFPSAVCGRKTCRAAADDDNIIQLFSHYALPPL